MTIKRRASKTSKGRPAPESLAWYKAEWAIMSKNHLPEAVIAGLAQLSYENRRLRKRVESLEAIQLAQLYGQVVIDGVAHLLECSKRDGPERTCTCGSLPDEASSREHDRERPLTMTDRTKN